MTKEELRTKLDEKKAKVAQKWEDFKAKGRNFVGWCADHPTETAAGITAIGACAAGTAKLVSKIDKKIDIQREDYRRKTEKYDPVTGSWLKLKRPLTNSEQIELAERRQNGESSTIILASMGLLKR